MKEIYFWPLADLAKHLHSLLNKRIWKDDGKPYLIEGVYVLHTQNGTMIKTVLVSNREPGQFGPKPHEVALELIFDTKEAAERHVRKERQKEKNEIEKDIAKMKKKLEELEEAELNESHMSTGEGRSALMAKQKI